MGSKYEIALLKFILNGSYEFVMAVLLTSLYIENNIFVYVTMLKHANIRITSYL